MHSRPKMVMLDRDGVINRNSATFIKSVAEWLPLPGSIESIVLLQKLDIKVAICTNQSGIARRLLTIVDLEAIHAAANLALKRAGGVPVAIFFCPHHPEDGCLCRKPQPLMLQLALKRAHVHSEDACFVGDSQSDMQAATAAGCEPIFIGPTDRLVDHPNGRSYRDLAGLVREIDRSF